VGLVDDGLPDVLDLLLCRDHQLCLAGSVRELDGQLEDALGALRHLLGLAFRLVGGSNSSILYVAVGRVLGLVGGLVGWMEVSVWFHFDKG
jgi:hypothetical protein